MHNRTILFLGIAGLIPAILLFSSFVSGAEILRIRPTINTSYQVFSISGNESCWGNVSVYGPEGRTVDIFIKPLAQRGCWYCNETGEDCVFLNATVPTTLAVSFKNQTRYVDLPQSGGRFIFTIPPRFKDWMRWVKLGSESVIIGDGEMFNATFVNTTQRFGTQGDVYPSYIFNEFTQSNPLWKNLTMYISYNRKIINRGDQTQSHYEADESPNNESFVTGVTSLALPQFDRHIVGSYGYALRYQSTTGSGVGLYTKSGISPKGAVGDSNWTVMGWFYNNASSSDLTVRYVIRQGSNSNVGSSVNNYLLQLRGNGQLVVSIGNGSTGSLVVNGLDIDGAEYGGTHLNKWRFFALRVNASRQVEFFIFNGTDLRNMTTGSGFTRTSMWYRLDNTTTIGASTSTGTPWLGMLDEIMSFNSSLSNAQILSIMRNQTRFYDSKGTVTFVNQNLSGNNSIIVSLPQGSEQWGNSNITVSVNNASEYLINNITNKTIEFNIPQPYNYANFTFHFYAGNLSGGEYRHAPILYDSISIETQDTIAPSITNLKEFPSEPVNYTPYRQYHFNATVTDENLANVYIEFNGINYTVTSMGNNVYQWTTSNILAGNYSYYWGAVDASNRRTTVVDSYNITLVPYANFSGVICLGYKTTTFSRIFFRQNVTCTR